MWDWPVDRVRHWPLDWNRVRGSDADWVRPFYRVRDRVRHRDGDVPLYWDWVRGRDGLGVTVDDMYFLGDRDQRTDCRCWGNGVRSRSGGDSDSRTGGDRSTAVSRSVRGRSITQTGGCGVTGSQTGRQA